MIHAAQPVRRARAVVAGLVIPALALVLAGCAAYTAHLSAGDAVDPGPVPVSAYIDADDIGLETIVRGGGGRSVPWGLVWSSPTSGFVGIVYEASACDPSTPGSGHQGVTLVQTRTAVQITVLDGGSSGATSGTCITQRQQGTVQLDRKLAGRTLLHAPTATGPQLYGG